jgi:hypothetical protein
MSKNQHSKIQERAHEIWEREGRPHGRHHEHWAQAEREIAAQAEPQQAAGENLKMAAAKSGNGVAKPRAKGPAKAAQSQRKGRGSPPPAHS